MEKLLDPTTTFREKNEYRDLTIFLFSLNSAITFLLYSEYGPISIAEWQIITKNKNIASTRER